MNDLFYKDRETIKKDKDQWAAYLAKGNTVVTAGPGSGKTRILTLKAISLLANEIYRPSGLACISYSRETVRELRKRLKGYGYQKNSHDFIGTIHGFCLLNIIIPFGHLFPQYKIPQPLKIASYELGMQLYHSVLSNLETDEDTLSKVALDKSRSLSVIGSSSIQLHFSDLEGRASAKFDELLSNSGHIDFISIVNIATQMIREQHYVRFNLESKFPWLLIDEYQDLGKALHEMVLELFATTSIKIFAVGDMNQSIYGFNGAYPDFLEELNLKDDFISIPLNSNYRSYQGIIEASLETLSPIPPRPKYLTMKGTSESAEFTFIECEKELQQQYKCVAKHVIPDLINKGIPYNEIGIIVGSNQNIISMSQVLNAEGIPFYLAKWGFDKSSDVAIWMQECATWCIDKSSQSFDELFDFWNNLLEHHNDNKTFWAGTQKRIFFYTVLNQGENLEFVLEWLNHMISELGLLKTLTDSERYPDEVENLNKIVREAKTGNLFHTPLRRFAFLGEPENEVTITTRHSSKGLEFEAVILLGMEEGSFPYYTHQKDSREFEEDKRTCYVCVSRAKRVCVLLYSKIITIPTQNGPWKQNKNPSIFWKALSEKFGNENNMFNFDGRELT